MAASSDIRRSRAVSTRSMTSLNLGIMGARLSDSLTFLVGRESILAAKGDFAVFP